MTQAMNADNVASFPKRVIPNDGTGRVPPHNIEAEESLLGAMLLSRDAIASAVEVIGAHDFYKPAHAHVFDAITSLYAQGEPADPVTVAEELRRAGVLDNVGGAAALISLQSNTPAIGNAARYARIVEEHSLLRKLIGVATEIAEMGYSVPDDVSDAIDRAESMVFDVASKRVTDTLMPIRELLSSSLDRLEALYERGEAITGVPTGYLDLDEQLAGLQPSSLVIVGARPAMGKCVAYNTPIVDPASGEVITVEELYMRGGVHGGDVEVLTLRDDHHVYKQRPSHFVDDGVKPVFRVRTGMGREIATTMSHPFLTPTGWRALADIAPGALIGVPRSLSVFGNDVLPENHVALLGYICSEAGITINTPRLFGLTDQVLEDVQSAAAELEAVLEHDLVIGVRNAFRVEAADGAHRNQFLDLAWRHGLVGVSAQERRIPRAIFRLPREGLALFLNRLFARGGSSFWIEDEDGEAQTYIHYQCVSHELAQQIQHLLLRFGCNAAIRRGVIHFQGERQLGYELFISNHDEVLHFIDEISMFGKEAELSGIAARLIARRREHEYDATPPRRQWPRVLNEKGDRTWSEYAYDVGASGEALHPSDTAVVVAQNREYLPSWRKSDILWDEVVSIDFDGDQQVYDFTVPDEHNFIASDVFVHNTSFALGLASHAAMEAKLPVLLFSLEMSHLEITQRMLCSEARVDATRMRNGKLLEADWPKISHAIGRLGEAPIFIDDNPNITIMDIRAKARRMKARDGLGLVVIDYLQLLSGRQNAESRQVEVSELSRGLKILARELEVPVVALSQLSRNLEQRADKRPILADLRESGSLEQDADVVMFLYRDEIYNSESSDRGLAEVIVSKHRNGPTGTTKLAFLDHYTRFANMARRSTP